MLSVIIDLYGVCRYQLHLHKPFLTVKYLLIYNNIARNLLSSKKNFINIVSPRGKHIMLADIQM